ncbi:MAG TPA: hypothetical protein VIJ04_00350 [Xanthobacteraceae bacterium]
MIEHVHETCALQGQDAKFGQQLLLPNALTQSAADGIVGLIVRLRLNDRCSIV